MRPITLPLIGVAILAGTWAWAAESRPQPPRSWLGINLAPPEPDPDGTAAEVPGTAARGALVAAVVKDSPADTAGLRSGDLLLDVGGVPVHSVEDVQRMVAAQAPGSWLDIELLRQSRKRSVSARVAARPDDAYRREVRRPFAGIVPLDVPKQLREFWGGSEREGVLVGAIGEGTPATRGGVLPGDLVLRVEGRPVASSREFARRIQLGGVGNAITLRLSRQGTVLDVRVQLEDEPPKTAAAVDDEKD